MTGQIEHSGVVDRVENGVVFVRIISQSACGACKARQACGMAESEVKIISVSTSDADRFAAGDAVTVGVRRDAGAMAVLLGYVGALVVLMAVLLTTIGGLGWSELQGASASLAGVLLYYIVLWLARRKIEHTIHFTIIKN